MFRYKQYKNQLCARYHRTSDKVEDTDENSKSFQTDDELFKLNKSNIQSCDTNNFHSKSNSKETLNESLDKTSIVLLDFKNRMNARQISDKYPNLSHELLDLNIQPETVCSLSSKISSSIRRKRMKVYPSNKISSSSNHHPLIGNNTLYRFETVVMDENSNEHIMQPIIDKKLSNKTFAPINKRVIRRMKPAEELAFSKRTSSKKSNIKENSLSLGSNVAWRNLSISKKIDNNLLNETANTQRYKCINFVNFENMVKENPKINRIRRSFQKGKKFYLKLNNK